MPLSKLVSEKMAGNGWYSSYPVFSGHLDGAPSMKHELYTEETSIGLLNMKWEQWDTLYPDFQ